MASGTRVRNRSVRRRVVDEFRTLRRLGQLLGYARASTDLQDPAPQHAALAGAGVERVWTDHASGTTSDRQELNAVLDYARDGDVLKVWHPDRLGRFVQHLMATVADLGRRGVELQSLSEGSDTTTAAGSPSTSSRPWRTGRARTGRCLARARPTSTRSGQCRSPSRSDL